MKYYFIATALHLLLFINFSKDTRTMGIPDHLSKTTVPISYNVKNLPPRIDNTKKVKGSQAKKAAPPDEKTVKEEVKAKNTAEVSPPKTAQKIKKNEPAASREKQNFKSTIKQIIPSDIQKKDNLKQGKEPSIPKKKIKVQAVKETLKDAKAEQKEPPQKQREETQPKEQLKKAEKTNTKKIPKNKAHSKDGNADTFSKNGNFTANADGSYTAHSAKGLDFKIVHQVEPDYPRLAKVISYGKTVVVEARFLVDLDGKVGKVNFIKSHEKFGFDKEVVKALKKWKFKPIVHKGKKLKVYFTKRFVFKSKS